MNEQGLIIQDLQTQFEEVNKQLEDKEKRIEDLEQASEQAEQAHNEKLEKRKVRLNVKNLKVLEKVLVLTDSNETLRTDNEELKKEISGLKLKVDELKNATNVDESRFEDEDDLKQRIESLLSEKTNSLSASKSEMEVLKTDRARLLSQVEKQETKYFAEVQTLIEKNALLEEELCKERSKNENEFSKLTSQVEENLNHIKIA